MVNTQIHTDGFQPAIGILLAQSPELKTAPNHSQKRHSGGAGWCFIIDNGSLYLLLKPKAVVTKHLEIKLWCQTMVFSERELMFMFAIIVVRPSVCRLSVCRLSVTFVHPTQPIEIFGNVSAPCNTLVI